MEARALPFVVVTLAMSGALLSGFPLGADSTMPHSRSAPNPGQATAAAPMDESVGEQIWLRDCAICHRRDGSGSDRGPSLDGVGAAGIDFAVATGRMPITDPAQSATRGPPKYGPAEIEALVEYTATFITGPAVPEADISDAELARGGRIYRAHCASCHQMAGRGGVLTEGRRIPKLVSSSPTEIVEAIRSGPNDMPVFPSAVLDDGEAIDIAAYVREISNPDDRGGWPLGRWGPVPEGAAALVLGLIPLVLLARWLGDRRDSAAEVVLDEDGDRARD